ncbi:signal transduction histidine kinase [Halorhodospira halochloris]|uniref:histidine kinase n=1 Tax=Halorhodospira halochloris TaxID=1052 RepID=A0A0X8X6W4_HALHR|nr:HAMP domain-containing sensor histidine kinase [Halorhodospira halochloris]MBK1650888.1 hypothetical protein [Halorhodospira halochloris]BAU56611.1 signal transduction histidine kinase [Halorhodospira halochloris]
MMTWRPRSLAIRLSATFLALTLAIAVPITLIFDHFAQHLIKDRVEQVIEQSHQTGVLDSDDLAAGFSSVRFAAVAMVSLTSLLAAFFGAWVAFRWRSSLQAIVQRGRRQANLVQPSIRPPENCSFVDHQPRQTDELAELEDQLIHTLERLSRSQWLLDSVDDIVILADISGYVRHGNAAMGTACACCPVPNCNSVHVASIIGNRLWQRIHSILSQGRSATIEDEVRIAGRDFPALISLRMQDGHAVIKITDLTEYRRLKEHMEKLQALSTLGEMSTELAHEIKNNIVPVKLLCELAPMNESDRDSVLRSLDHIHNLVHDFMDFGSGKSSNSKVLALSSALESWTEVLRTNAKRKGVRLEVDAPDTEVQLPSGLRVVYANLVRNAIQAAPADGYVKVHACLDDHGTLELSIADNGEGIPEHIRERIFEPFATTRAEGTGLGLALVERYVHEAGGYVTCESQPQQGSTFRISWPQAARADADSGAGSFSNSNHHSAGKSRG